MYVFGVDCFAETASFRVPEAHTFQQTLPLPPVTTLWGMAGAALGLEFPSVCSWVRENAVGAGVWGRHSGRTRDHWKYTKVKDREVLKDVLLREGLCDLELVLVYGGEDRAVLDDLCAAFRQPRFALTAGTSDSLLKVRRVCGVEEACLTPESSLEHTVLAGNLAGQAKLAVDLKNLPITERVSAPQVHLLPTEFRFSGIERRAVKRDYFTFVESPVEFSTPIPVCRVSGRKVGLL